MLIDSRPQIDFLPLTKQRAYRVEAFRKQKFDFTWHQHAEVELTYVVSGYGVRYLGDSLQPFAAGDLCLIGAQVPHGYSSHPSAAAAEWIVLQFSPEAWGRQFWALPENKPLADLLERAQAGIQFAGEVCESCGSLLRGLLGAVEAPGVGRFLAVLEALAGAQDFSLLNAAAQYAECEPRLAKVLAWAEANAGGEVDQSEAARLTGLSPAAFSRFFRHKTGRVFTRHINEIRVVRARASMDRDGERPLAEIAAESGFSNEANLKRWFREITGKSPRDYRESL